MTGSHGFVGSNLIEALGDEHEIIRWDARENRALPECDAVIHLAGLAHDVKKSDGRWKKEDYFRVNADLTKRIYGRFLESSAKKFIFFSSIKAKDLDTAYAQSKRCAEEYIIGTQEFSTTYFTNDTNKKVYILRPCMIHGKGNKGNLNLLVKWVKKGWPWPLAAFENKRSFASMGNVSFVVDQLLKKDVASGVYEVCDDEPVSTNELIGIVSQCMDKEVKMVRVPKWLMNTIAIMCGALHLPLNGERLRKLTTDYVVDNSKLKQSLGIGRFPIDARAGLRDSIQSLINN